MADVTYPPQPPRELPQDDLALTEDPKPPRFMVRFTVGFGVNAFLFTFMCRER